MTTPQNESIITKVGDAVSNAIPEQVTDKVIEILPDAVKDIDIARVSKPWIENWNWLIDRTPSLIAVIVLALLLMWINRQVTARFYKIKTRKMTDAEGVRRVETVVQVIRYAGNVIIGVVMVLALLDKFGIAVGPLLGAAGIVGIAAGFGAQSLVKDYFTGIFLLVEDQLRQGDVVDIGGKSGVVEEVTLRYVRLRDYEGSVHFVPNNLITSVTNRSRGFAFAVMDVNIAYKENIDRCMEIMREVGAELRQDSVFGPKIWEDLDIAGVQQWADSAVILRCRFKVKPLEQWAVKREYLRRLKAAFDVRGVEIPYPHMTVYSADGGQNPFTPTTPPSLQPTKIEDQS